MLTNTVSVGPPQTPAVGSNWRESPKTDSFHALMAGSVARDSSPPKGDAKAPEQTSLSVKPTVQSTPGPTEHASSVTQQSGPAKPNPGVDRSDPGRRVDDPVDDAQSDVQRRSDDGDRLMASREAKESRGSKAPMAALGGKAQRKVMQKFMDSFESEFDVPSTRLVEAMTKLSPKDQLKAPEQTADKVIGALNMDDEQGDKAKAMYVGFLAELQKANEPVKLAVSNTSWKEADVHSRFMEGVDKRNRLNQSLESLNSKFWVHNGRMDRAQLSPEQVMMQQPSMDEQMNAELVHRLSADLANDPQFVGRLKNLQPAIAGAGASQMSADEVDPSDEAALRGALRRELLSRGLVEGDDEMGSPMSGGAAAAAFAASRAAGPEGMSAMQAASLQEASDANAANIARLKMLKSMPGKNLDGKSAEALMKAQGQVVVPNRGDQMRAALEQLRAGPNGLSKKSAAFGAEAGDATAAGKADADALAMGGALSAEGANALRNQSPAQVDTKALDPNAALVSPQDKHANIQNILNQAQILLKKGGGEVKVDLHPQGLGAVHLKLALQDGRVSMQMATETKEAQKIIESSLGDLRQSLAAHRLSIDHMKVDVVGRTNTDLAQGNLNQNNFGSNAQSQRETRQFWNNFQESFGSQDQRDGFFEIPSTKGYGPAQTNPMRPVDVTSVAARSARADGRGRSVDYVA